MASKTHFTTGEIAEQCGVPIWLVRRVVDGLGEQVPRFGPYRLIPAELVGRVKEELQRRDSRKAVPCG